jgi:corrinoid protein of di/trimethylamine methyltransferase
MKFCEGLLKELCDHVSNLHLEDVRKIACKAIESGIPASDVLESLCKGMEIIGEKYERGEYFLAELMFSAEVMKAGLEIISPHLKSASERVGKSGIIVVATVKGDLHDLGKNLFVTLARSAGFETIDLGVDVPTEIIVKKVKETNADIIGLSALLSTTMYHMREVIEALKAEGIRNKVKVIIGGAGVSQRFADEIGADAAAKDAFQGVEICKKWINERDDAHEIRG